MSSIEAVSGMPRSRRRVSVQLHQHRGETLIRVRDWGKGVQDDHLPRIFEREFTTKAGHSGIGLSLVARFADLVLEAVARQEGIQVTAEDLDREIRALAEATGRDPKEVRRILERSRQVTSLAGDIIRSKALDLLVESAEVMREGAPATPEPDPSVSQEDKT